MRTANFSNRHCLLLPNHKIFFIQAWLDKHFQTNNRYQLLLFNSEENILTPERLKQVNVNVGTWWNFLPTGVVTRGDFAKDLCYRLYWNIEINGVFWTLEEALTQTSSLCIYDRPFIISITVYGWVLPGFPLILNLAYSLSIKHLILFSDVLPPQIHHFNLR